MKRLFLLLLLCSLSSLFASAQDLVTIRGHVADERGKDVKAATILADDHSATVTNDDGDFILKTASTSKTITISHLGFTSQQVNIVGKSDISVRLQSTAVMLNDVLIGKPEDILALAIESIPQNYVMVPELQRCFYRETTRKGRRYIYVAEAVTDIYKTAYNRDIVRDKVVIEKARRLVSTQASDTLGAKIAGGPLTPVILDLVKNLPYLLNEEMLVNYSYSMRPSPTTTDGHSEVIVTIRPDRPTEQALLWGDFFIDTKTLAIRHIDLQLDMNDKEKASNFLLQRKPFGVKFKPQSLDIHISYRPDENGKLFLGYICSEVSFKCDWKRKFFSAGYHVTSEMVVTDLTTGDVKPIRGRSSFRDRESLYDHPEYFGDPVFWKQYNIIAPTESLEKGIKRFMKKLDD